MPTQQVRFDKVNVVAPFDGLAPNEVSAAQNIDFSIAGGGLISRRGSTVFGAVSSAPITQIFRNYNQANNIAACPFYIIDSSGNAYRGTGGSSWTTIASGLTGQVGLNAFGTYAMLGAMGTTVKDDGAKATDWIKQSPGTPVITINTLTPLDVSNATATYSITDGLAITTATATVTVTDIATSTSGTATATATATASAILGTASSTTTVTATVIDTGTSFAATGTSTATAIAVAFALVTNTDTTSYMYFITDANGNASALMTFGGSTDLSSNGTHSIGAMGIFFLNMAFGNPANITQVSQDYSVGDATFQNYWHAQITPQNGIVVPLNADPVTLVNAQLSYGTATGSTLTIDQKAEMISQIRDQTQPALSGLSQLAGTLSPWGVGQTEFGFVGSFNGTNVDPWSQVYAMRINIQSLSTNTIVIGTAFINGALNYPLNDISVGYTWWQTFATLDTNGNKIGESAPSPPTAQFQVQEANALVVSSAGGTGGTANGINAIVTYRQGGYAQTGYAVNTQSASNGAVSTFTDTVNDVQSISANFPIVTNVQAQSSYLFANMDTVSEPFLNRVFYGENNNLHFSLPGQLDTFPNTSFAQVSYIGDNIKALSAWPTGLVIVNQYSVYEFTGGALEAGQYQLSRSASQKGSIAPNVCVKTPYGIPLLSYDGLSMYQPGQGVAIEIDWLRQEWGDLFYGGAANAPGSMKYAPGFEGVAGAQRARPINYGHIIGACAAYGQGKLYLAVPTGTNTFNDTVYVLDFVNRKVNLYSYFIATQSIGISALYWDVQNNNLVAGTTDGKLMSLESGQVDFTTAGAAKPVTFTSVTQQWTVPSDTILENVSALVQCEDPITITAIMDGLPAATATLTSTSSTTGGATRSWIHVPLNGTFANSLAFYIVGNQAANATIDGLYQLNFDLTPEPTKVVYYRTPYDDKSYEADKLWDVAYHDIDITGVGTVTCVVFVDSTAVMTNTLVSTGSTGRLVYEFAFPPEIYGRVAYTTYTSTNTWTQTLVSGTSTTTGTTTGTATVTNAPIPYTNIGPNYFKLWRTYYDARNEPPKINYWRTDIESLEENICDAFDVDINPNGTVTATCYVDNVAITTATITTVSGGGTKRQSYTITLPEEQYGRTIYVAYTGTGFKHYKTWFHLRQEPDRWTSFVTAKYSGPEHEYKVFRPELNCLGGTVLATATVDGTAVGTYTITGSTRQSYTFSLPAETFGRTVWASYQAVSTAQPFKHYWNQMVQLQASSQYYEGSVEFVGDLEPDRVTIWRTGPNAYPDGQYLKTWNCYLDPLNNVVSGTLTVDDIAVATCTFTGNKRQYFTVGLDLDPSFNVITTGSRWEVLYNSVGTGDFLGKFKHYDTKLETEPKPFGKDRWAYSYRKIGGASQVDLPRFWSLEAEYDQSAGPELVVNYYWDLINGTNFTSGTLTLTGGVQWIDRISFPPGGRSYLFLFRITSNPGGAYQSGTPFKVYKVNIDLDQEGIKGLVRRETPGTPLSKSND